MRSRGARPLIEHLAAPPEILRALAARDAARYPVLLESAASGPLGRFSVLAASPRESLWLDATGAMHATHGRNPALQSRRQRQAGFFAALEDWWQAERSPLAREGLPFVGGWVVFLGYEMASEIEPHLRLPPARLPLRAFALRTPAALIHDRVADQLIAAAEPGEEAALARLAADVASTAAGLADATPVAPAISATDVVEEDPERFLARVQRAQEYIRAGDIYQANLSRPWRARLPLGISASSLYERLRLANPAPFAALASFRGLSILSSSPERLLRIDQGTVSTRPIAGTRARSRRLGEDRPEAAALVTHPKERAEHVMLIDLERNDLGRISEAGSVVVDEFMAVETYEHVHHIVSNVRGRLRADVSPVGALRAVFPGGTITGCPKLRCMQIIAELEGEGRGAYTGSLGYLGPDGSADFNILIRTMTLCEGQLELRAGAGIVADSQPLRELEETRAKARGMLAALEPTP